MAKKYFKKILAQSPQDLQIISALCSGAKVKLSNIKYLSKNKLFILSIERNDTEQQKKNKKIYSVIKFDFIDFAKTKNINQKDSDYNLQLLTIDLLKIGENYEITLLFNKNQIISLSAEIIEAVLEDQKYTDDKDIR